MPIRTEIHVRLPNSPGALNAVCRLLDTERINIQALALEANGQLRLVVDNHVRAIGVLREQHYAVGDRAVIVTSVANGPGGLVSALQLLADTGTNLEYAYASATEASATAAVVFGVADATRAASASGL
jgi:hypothetical protein